MHREQVILLSIEKDVQEARLFVALLHDRGLEEALVGTCSSRLLIIPSLPDRTLSTVPNRQYLSAVRPLLNNHTPNAFMLRTKELETLVIIAPSPPTVQATNYLKTITTKAI